MGASVQNPRILCACSDSTAINRWRNILVSNFVIFVCCLLFNRV
uniref:Uncharacterized protein n=1 Tax=Arundo donax TaxID=35708 RepID=A0A0A9GRW9_ARUDO